MQAEEKIRPSEFRAHTQRPTTTNTDTLEWHSPTYTWQTHTITKIMHAYTYTHLHIHTLYTLNTSRISAFPR